MVVALAAGSAAVGAARGTADSLQITGALAGDTAVAAGTTRAPAPATSTPAAATTAAAGTPTSTKPTTTKPKTTKRKTTKSDSSQNKRAKPKTTVPTSGTGKLKPVRVPGADSSGPGRVVTYAFEVEDGIGVDRAAAAKVVGAALRDPRGWEGVDGVRFVQLTAAQRAAGTKPTVTISLVSPKMTDRMCAPLSTAGTWSCANKDHAVLNYRRWALATPTFASTSLGDYQRYVVNHEVGHELGHSHAKCSGKGKLAAVMVQQSKGLSGCKPNVWPKATRG